MNSIDISNLTSPLMGKHMLTLASSTIKLAATFLQKRVSSTAAPNLSVLPEYSLDQVSSHSYINDCWVVIADKVYDITKFINEHPGGFEIMMEQAGRDATLHYRGVGHSDDADENLSQFLIGILPAKERMYTNKTAATL